MALTAIEQLTLLDTNGLPNLTRSLEDVVKQTALEGAVILQLNEKNTEGDVPATSYIVKVKQVTTRIAQGDGGILGSIAPVLIATLSANTAFDLTTIQAAPEGTVLSYISDQIGLIVEVIAGVTAAEKTAYNALP